jgi:hypothetical protein
MPIVPSRPRLDDAAGLLVRPYAVSDGRTRPTAHFDLMTMVAATASTSSNVDKELGPEHAQVLVICQQPVAVAEIAARLRWPAVVVKVLLSDLMESGSITIRSADATLWSADRNIDVLEAVLDGLSRL